MSQVKTAWQTALINAVTQPDELLRLLDLGPSWLDGARHAATLFPLKVPHGFIRRMQKGNIHDPLLRQVLPIGAELLEIPGFTTDPLQETDNAIPGLLHKYQGRVLLTLTGTCAIHCRFCFRRHFPYSKNNPGTEGWKAALNYIANDPTITEVILSGGDPLSLSDAILDRFIQSLSAISHVKRLRFHSRLPIVLPERITPDLIQLLTKSRLSIVFVVHCNHPQEIDASVKSAMQNLSATNITLLNQSVLLKGINDHADILTELSESLFDMGVLPYYLHVLDKVQGTAHFDTPLDTAHLLHAQIAARLPGYLVPRLVREDPGAPAKTLLR